MRVGCTGHRPNRLHIGEERLSAHLREVLTVLRSVALARDGPDGKLIAISPLAEGSDSLFAEVAMTLGYSLHSMLPFPSADYETTFSDRAIIPAYRALLARSEEVVTLPGTLADTKAAFESVGRVLVDSCDVLLTLWDGKPAAGRGGTTDIIGFALARARPVVWIDAAQDRAPVLLERLLPAPSAIAFSAGNIGSRLGV